METDLNHALLVNYEPRLKFASHRTSTSFGLCLVKQQVLVLPRICTVSIGWDPQNNAKKKKQEDSVQTAWERIFSFFAKFAFGQAVMWQYSVRWHPLRVHSYTLLLLLWFSFAQARLWRRLRICFNVFFDNKSSSVQGSRSKMKILSNALSFTSDDCKQFIVNWLHNCIVVLFLRCLCKLRRGINISIYNNKNLVTYHQSLCTKSLSWLHRIRNQWASDFEIWHRRECFHPAQRKQRIAFKKLFALSTRRHECRVHRSQGAAGNWSDRWQ